MDSELWVCNVGTIDYPSALALQERIRDARQAGLIGRAGGAQVSVVPEARR